MASHDPRLSPPLSMTFRKCPGLDELCGRNMWGTLKPVCIIYTEEAGDRLKSWVPPCGFLLFLEQQTHHRCTSVCFSAGRHNSHVSFRSRYSGFSAADSVDRSSVQSIASWPLPHQVTWLNLSENRLESQTKGVLLPWKNLLYLFPLF